MNGGGAAVEADGTAVEADGATVAEASEWDAMEEKKEGDYGWGAKVSRMKKGKSGKVNGKKNEGFDTMLLNNWKIIR